VLQAIAASEQVPRLGCSQSEEDVQALVQAGRLPAGSGQSCYGSDQTCVTLPDVDGSYEGYDVNSSRFFY